MYWSETTYSIGLGRKYKTGLILSTVHMFIYLLTCQIHLSINNLMFFECRNNTAFIHVRCLNTKNYYFIIRFLYANYFCKIFCA